MGVITNKKRFCDINEKLPGPIDLLFVVPVCDLKSHIFRYILFIQLNLSCASLIISGMKINETSFIVPVGYFFCAILKNPSTPFLFEAFDICLFLYRAL